MLAPDEQIDRCSPDVRPSFSATSRIRWHRFDMGSRERHWLTAGLSTVWAQIAIKSPDDHRRIERMGSVTCFRAGRQTPFCFENKLVSNLTAVIASSRRRDLKEGRFAIE